MIILFEEAKEKLNEKKLNQKTLQELDEYLFKNCLNEDGTLSMANISPNQGRSGAIN